MIRAKELKLCKSQVFPPLLKFLIGHMREESCMFMKCTRTSLDRFPLVSPLHMFRYHAENLVLTDTYCYKDTVQVHRFTPTWFSSFSTQYFSQTPGVVDSQDADVILTAESLNECEVDLQGHIFHILVVGGQDAQNHIIRVSEGGINQVLFFLYSAIYLLPAKQTMPDKS